MVCEVLSHPSFHFGWMDLVLPSLTHYACLEDLSYARLCTGRITYAAPR